MRTRIRDLHETWLRERDYRDAWEALRDEFEVASAIVDARARAGLTQAELAERIGTRQPAIARIEGGQLPSTSTLLKIAAATCHRLRIVFEPSTP